MKENFFRIKDKEEEYSHSPMEILMMDNLKETSFMEKEDIHGILVMFLKEIS